MSTSVSYRYLNIHINNTLGEHGGVTSLVVLPDNWRANGLEDLRLIRKPLCDLAFAVDLRAVKESMEVYLVSLQAYGAWKEAVRRSTGAGPCRAPKEALNRVNKAVFDRLIRHFEEVPGQKVYWI